MDDLSTQVACSCALVIYCRIECMVTLMLLLIVRTKLAILVVRVIITKIGTQNYQ